MIFTMSWKRICASAGRSQSYLILYWRLRRQKLLCNRRNKKMRKRVLLVLVAVAVMAVFASLSFAAALSESPGIKDRQQIKEPKANVIKAVKRCPDLSATSIDFSIVSKTSQFEGTVRITGVIKNVGNKAYTSSPHQQSIMLYEGTQMVAQKPFQNLAVGQQETITFERKWNASSPSEGEFPPEYKLTISFDPDITLDSNPDNDECNSANNRKSRSGAGINRLFNPIKPPVKRK